MENRRKIWLAFLLLPAAFLLVPQYGLGNIAVSYAGLTADVSIERLAEASDIIVVGRCLTSYSDWNSKKTEICTYTLFDPLEILKGKADAPLIIETLGGQAGSLVSTVIGSPEFAKDHKYLLFLFRKNSGQLGIVGLNKGKFNICQDNNEEIVVNPHTRNIILPEIEIRGSEDDRTQKQINLSKLITIIKNCR